MWELYRKRVIPTQIFILVLIALAIYIGKLPAFAIVFLFLSMELFAILGARWAWRLLPREEKERRRERLKDLTL